MATVVHVLFCVYDVITSIRVVNVKHAHNMAIKYKVEYVIQLNKIKKMEKNPNIWANGIMKINWESQAVNLINTMMMMDGVYQLFMGGWAKLKLVWFQETVLWWFLK